MYKLVKLISEVKTMILVLFFILALILIIIFFSHIKIKINQVTISNMPKYYHDFDIKIGIYLFNKIRLVAAKLDKETTKQSKILHRVKEALSEKGLTLELKRIPKLNELKKINVNLEEIHLDVKIGTEDVILTSAIVAILSSVIGIILGKAIKQYDEDKHRYTILPFYNNKNLFELKLNSIINVKLVHIIYVIYMFSKKRSENENERTSNRGSYDYSYE